MKKVSLLLFVFVFTLSAVNAQKFKYGHIDGNSVFRKMPEAQKADSLYAQFVKQLEDHIKGMQEDYNAKLKDFREKEASLSDVLKQAQVEEINSLGERIQKFQVSAQKEAEKKQAELFNPVRSKFNEALKNIAKKHGYKFIIDKGALLYFDDSDDVTKLVEKELGVKK